MCIIHWGLLKSDYLKLHIAIENSCLAWNRDYENFNKSLNLAVSPPVAKVMEHTRQELNIMSGLFLFNSVDPNDQKKTACYDIDVEVDDTLKTQMNSFLLSTASQQEIAGLDNKVQTPAGQSPAVLFMDTTGFLCLSLKLSDITVSTVGVVSCFLQICSKVLILCTTKTSPHIEKTLLSFQWCSCNERKCF